jgi:hypothetical protein
MMEIEDGKQKSINLFVGSVAVAAVVYVMYCRATGKPVWDSTPAELMGSSVPQSLLEIVFFAVSTIGGVIVGGYHAILPTIKGFFGFLVPQSQPDLGGVSRLPQPMPNVSAYAAPVAPVTGFVPVAPVTGRVILTVGDDGVPRRDVDLEKQVNGPQTHDEIFAAYAQAGIDGDWEKAGEWFDLLHPEQAK